MKLQTFLTFFNFLTFLHLIERRPAPPAQARPCRRCTQGISIDWKKKFQKGRNCSSQRTASVQIGRKSSKREEIIPATAHRISIDWKKKFQKGTNYSSYCAVHHYRLEEKVEKGKKMFHTMFGTIKQLCVHYINFFNIFNFLNIFNIF